MNCQKYYRSGTGGGGGGAVKKFIAPKMQSIKTKPVLDARNKIIQKNRAKIHDARDKLAQIAKRSGDARLKLLQKNIRFLKKVGELDTAVTALKRASNPVVGLKTQKRAAAVAAAAAPLKRAPYQRAIVEDVAMDMDMEYYPTSTNLRRTVKNDTIMEYVPTSSMPPLPTFNRYIEPVRRMTTATRSADYEADPFDCYEVPVARPYDVSEPRNLNRSVLGAHMDAYQPKSIRSSGGGGGGGGGNVMGSLEYERPLSLSSSHYKSGSDLMSSKRYIADENSHLSHEMRTRLQRPPDVTQSAGIFTNPYISNSRERQITSAGYRIVVSNLHSSVSQSDIKVNWFLFGYF